MVKIIAIFALTSNLSVAVETGTGRKEETFNNDHEVVAQLVDFVERTVGEQPDGVKVVLGWRDEGESTEHITEYFVS